MGTGGTISFVGCVPFFERANNIAERSIVVRSTEDRTLLLKQNGRFRRFHLRGLEKVEVEWGILSMAYNLKKLAVG